MWFVFIAFDRLIKNLGEWKLGVHFRKLALAQTENYFAMSSLDVYVTMDFRRTFLSAARWITTQRKKFYTCFYYGIIFGKQFFFRGAGGAWMNCGVVGWNWRCVRPCPRRSCVKSESAVKLGARNWKSFWPEQKKEITHKTEPNWTVCHYVHKANVSPKPKCVSKLILNDLKYKHIYFLLFVCSSLGFFSR